ncbi:hypothetical protein HYPSUDRAFT_46339 [Hypholoma sublateritium FD-334 SS-4]|uniref:Uncharacterized protein n=1 Tax=Hypholoma sublateritium (strain FD-334 SS-4) TaxID=945553 RepID=A0A0D2PB52_HYPSF|nr:hypothetical protein HYPSUDRAFT_46339 [Hypholoma sublateritium FD-334 SS-4]
MPYSCALSLSLEKIPFLWWIKICARPDPIRFVRRVHDRNPSRRSEDSPSSFAPLVVGQAHRFSYCEVEYVHQMYILILTRTMLFCAAVHGNLENGA